MKSFYVQILVMDFGNEQAVPCPDLSRWVSAARPSVWETAAADVGRPAAQRGLGGGDFLYLCTFSYASSAGILITVFT
jgi:hypothetical protein